jgi:hypothetical protein
MDSNSFSPRRAAVAMRFRAVPSESSANLTLSRLGKLRRLRFATGKMERADLQFRGEFFNLFNIVNMGLPANAIEVQDLA